MPCAAVLITLQSLAARRALHDVAPPRDVLLFEHEGGRFFAVLGLFCAGQGVFWASLAIAALARPPASTRPPDAESPGRGRLDLRSALWRYGLAVGCGAIGKVWFAFPAWVEEGGHNPLRLGKKSKGLPTLQDEQATLKGVWYKPWILCNIPNSSLEKKTPLSCVTPGKSFKFFVSRFLHRKMRLITVFIS